MASLARRPVPQTQAPKRTRSRVQTEARAAKRAAPAPIVKWAGGKSKLAGELLARAPAEYARYFEPFVGGGALFFRLAPKAAVLGDNNPDLIQMYRAVARDVEGVLRRLRLHRQRHDEAYFYKVRQAWNAGEHKAASERAAAFIYLNKTCYNGLWRVNSRGHFNVPVGRYVDPAIYEPTALRAASRVLRSAELKTRAFAESVSPAGPGDLVYFDPPYHPLTETANFTSYTSASFGERDQRELAEVARDLHDRGCYVMISNSDAPLIRRLYKGFRIEQVMCARAINSVGKKRGQVSELIITNHR